MPDKTKKREAEPIGTYIYTDIREAVDDHCHKTGKKLMWVVNQALEEYLLKTYQ